MIINLDDLTTELKERLKKELSLKEKEYNNDIMYEVDFTGWCRDEESLYKSKTNFWYRWGLHWKRCYEAIKQRRWHYFNYYNIKGLLFNERKQFK